MGKLVMNRKEVRKVREYFDDLLSFRDEKEKSGITEKEEDGIQKVKV